jgi:mediator of replication checkpoint protein 1
MLTPRSKIKALLATVASSDEEGSDSSAKKTKIGNLKTSTAALLGSDNDDGDESDVVDIRPRGKLASRMQGAGRTTTTTTTTAATSPSKGRKLNQPEDARERVRKMFEREQELENAKTQEAAAPTQDTAAEDDDDDEDLSVVSRRFQRRQARETTPEDKETTPRQASPGLFVSPAGFSPSKNTDTANSDSDEDDLPSLKSDRFKALVERKRQERLAREAAEEAKREERRAQQEKLSSEMGELDSADDNVSDITDDDGGRKLTQDGARPSRKASRKAVEEMNRETQRMARSMQLAHDAKTRKKISKNSLFERFNFRPAGEPQEQLPPQPQSSSRPTTPQSDIEMGDAETPPTSPPSTKKQAEAAPVPEVAEDDCEDLPTLDAISTSPTVPKVDKGKGKAVDVLQEAPADTKTKRRVRVKFPPLSKTLAMADSDDELQITASTKDKINAVFDSVPLNQARESRSLQAFRALALVRSPETSRGRRKVELSKMTPNEMLSSLQQKARAQAKVERDRRMDLLKSQGIEVQTVEERERQMEEVENIVAKAREEAEKLRYQERDEVKKGKKGDTAADPLAWDDSDDEYQASEKEDNEQLSAIELSGSEDEGDGEADDAGADADDESDVPNPMFDDEAEESENEEADAVDKVTEIPDNEGGDDDEEPQIKRRRARNKTAVLSDDEDDETITATPKPVKSGNVVSPAQPSTDTPAAPSSVLRSAKKTFIPGLPVQGPAGLGLTQIFAGTMDDSQMSPAPNGGPTQSMLPDFDDFPNSNFSATADQPMDDVIESTQLEDTQRPTQGIKLNMSQSQMHGLDSLMRESYDGQESQTIELSQDGGFQTYTPIRDRFVEPPHSTVNTVVTGKEDDDQASPLVRRGRLRRKAEVDTAAEPTQPLPSEVPKPASAFNVMKEHTKQKDKRRFTEAFDKKKSKAKEMVEQEAEESDDEYAGLGGVDGEDSDNESIASMKEMIDDEGHDNADDSKLAAFYA